MKLAKFGSLIITSAMLASLANAQSQGVSDAEVKIGMSNALSGNGICSWYGHEKWSISLF